MPRRGCACRAAAPRPGPWAQPWNVDSRSRVIDASGAGPGERAPVLQIGQEPPVEACRWPELRVGGFTTPACDEGCVGRMRVPPLTDGVVVVVVESSSGARPGPV